MRTIVFAEAMFFPHPTLTTYYPRTQHEIGDRKIGMDIARMVVDMSEEASAYRLGLHSRDYAAPGVRK